MNIGAHILRDRPHDLLNVGRKHILARRQPFDTKPAIMKHRLNDRRIFQKYCDGRPSVLRSMRAPRNSASK